MEANCLCTLESPIYPGKPVRPCLIGPFLWQPTGRAFMHGGYHSKVKLQSSFIWFLAGAFHILEVQSEHSSAGYMWWAVSLGFFGDGLSQKFCATFKDPPKTGRPKFGTHLQSCTGGGTKRDCHIFRGYSHEKAVTFSKAVRSPAAGALRNLHAHLTVPKRGTSSATTLNCMWTVPSARQGAGGEERTWQWR